MGIYEITKIEILYVWQIVNSNIGKLKWTLLPWEQIIIN